MAKLIKNYNQITSTFNSSMLELGEMMEVEEDDINGLFVRKGDILFRVYDLIITLNRPDMTYDAKEATISGRKLKSGDSITLIQ